ncbi:MAG: NADH-quinone oxidoreductase subunit C [Bacteroidia bacterium]|nr:NADH-quinone oxidoreductase subunit C [Bacteroidia bacterium]MDW8014672.1 NADH-quinone oxidoreductase subunit C [Bacteroidia bacterium]
MFKTWNASFLEHLRGFGKIEAKPFGYHLHLSEPLRWREVALILKEEGEVEYFVALTATHKPPLIQLRYDLRSLLNLIDISVSFLIPETEAVPSVADIWKAAEWQEREAYDLVGVRFEGHPNLKRLLLPEDWVGHPLRQDYEFPSAYREVPLLYQPPDASV